jgi:hypothetical protein
LAKRLNTETNSNKFDELSEIILDHALLADGSQLENPADYVRRINNLLLNIESKKKSTVKKATSRKKVSRKKTTTTKKKINKKTK